MTMEIVRRMVCMKDDLGLYYYPYPHNKSVRMYVKEEENLIFFRLWNGKDKKLWDDHGWIPYEAIVQAMDMYRGGGEFNPNHAYDITIARTLIKEDKKMDAKKGPIHL